MKKIMKEMEIVECDSDESEKEELLPNEKQILKSDDEENDSYEKKVK